LRLKSIAVVFYFLLTGVHLSQLILLNIKVRILKFAVHINLTREN